MILLNDSLREEPLYNFWDFNDFYLIFLARIATMSLKYGFYSKENFYIFRNSYQRISQILSGLISQVTVDGRPNNI